MNTCISSEFKCFLLCIVTSRIYLYFMLQNIVSSLFNNVHFITLAIMASVERTPSPTPIITQHLLRRVLPPHAGSATLIVCRT